MELEREGLSPLRWWTTEIPDDWSEGDKKILFSFSVNFPLVITWTKQDDEDDEATGNSETFRRKEEQFFPSETEYEDCRGVLPVARAKELEGTAFLVCKLVSEGRGKIFSPEIPRGGGRTIGLSSLFKESEEVIEVLLQLFKTGFEMTKGLTSLKSGDERDIMEETVLGDRNAAAEIGSKINEGDDLGKVESIESEDGRNVGNFENFEEILSDRGELQLSRLQKRSRILMGSSTWNSENITPADSISLKEEKKKKKFIKT